MLPVRSATGTKIAGEMGVAHLPGEDVVEGVFPLDPLDEGQAGPLGGVRNIRIFLVLMADELPDVVKGETEAGVEPSRLLQPPFDQFGIHELPDERCRKQADSGGDNLFFDLPADRLGGRLVDHSLADQRLDDPLAVPAGDLLTGGADEKRDVGGFRIGRHRRVHMFVFEAPSTAPRARSAARARRSSWSWFREKTRRWTTRAGMKR